MTRPLPDPETLRNAVAMTRSGERLGPVVALFPAQPGEEPGWAWVRTGITDADVRLVPLAEAHYHDGGLVIPFTGRHIDGAPQHPAGDELPARAQRELRHHYAFHVDVPQVGTDTEDDAPRPVPPPEPQQRPAAEPRRGAEPRPEPDLPSEHRPGRNPSFEETPVPATPSAPIRGPRPDLRREPQPRPVRGTLPAGHGVTEPLVEKLLRFGRRAAARLRRS